MTPEQQAELFDHLDRSSALRPANCLRLAQWCVDHSEAIKADVERLQQVSDIITRLQSENDRLSRALAARQWQPISSAPQDGTRILIFRPGHGWRVAVAWWHESVALYGDSIGFFKDATHWQPLPEPPTLAAPAAQKPDGQEGA